MFMEEDMRMVVSEEDAEERVRWICSDPQIPTVYLFFKAFLVIFFTCF